jgi:hypothetical protein
MDEVAPQDELLRALGKLVRGLSALFWGLPITLLICVRTATSDRLRHLEMLPPILSMCLLYYGLLLLGDFQKQERIWRHALDRAKFVAIVNIGLSPFIYWWNQIPSEMFYDLAIYALMLSGLLFLFNLNHVLQRLAAMLPDETLRHETKEFTTFNLWLLVFWLIFAAASIAAFQLNLQMRFDAVVWNWIERARDTVLLFLGLTPLAITMALIWKTKEVIFNGVFGARQ